MKAATRRPKKPAVLEKQISFQPSGRAWEQLKQLNVGYNCRHKLQPAYKNTSEFN